MEEYIFEFTGESVNGMKNISLFNARCTGDKIVRCRDCRYYNTEFTNGWCVKDVDWDDDYGNDGFSVSENDYCSFGVEKEA